MTHTGGGRAGRALFGIVFGGAAVVVLVFLLLPVVAIFTHVSPADLVGQLGRPEARDAIIVTVRTTLIAQVLILVIGTPAAYLIATRSVRSRAVTVTLIELPLVMPPAVAGIGLLAAFGDLGLLGGAFSALGISIAFTEVAVVMAVAYVASPFYLRQAVAAFEAVDAGLVDAARTLGAGPLRVFGRIVLPLALRGLAAGAALSFARGIGEFGATIMFAGSMQGVTQTLSLAIYRQFDVNFDLALALGGLLIIVSALVLLTTKILPLWTRSKSTSDSRDAISSSI